MSGLPVVFRNAPFVAEFGGTTGECVPVILKEEAVEWDLGIMTGSRTFWWNAHHWPLLAVWRGTEILRHLEKIEDGDLCYASYAGLRHSHPSNAGYIRSITGRIGGRTYRQIFSMKVPDEIIQLILQNIQQLRHYVPSYYFELEEEIELGTMAWHDEFAELGIRRAEELKKLKRFRKLIDSAVEQRGWAIDSSATRLVEYTLLHLLEKGMDASYPDDVLVVLANIGMEWADKRFELYMSDCLGDKKKTLAVLASWLSARRQRIDRQSLREIAEAALSLGQPVS